MQVQMRQSQNLRTLCAWIGAYDKRASQGCVDTPGPICRAVQEFKPSDVCLFSCWKRTESDGYKSWLQSSTGVCARLYDADMLDGPNDFGGIYCFVRDCLHDYIGGDGGGNQLVFHLSPGTPVMAASWILLASTEFREAELIESSQMEVKRVRVPFEISSEYAPQLPESKILQVLQGAPLIDTAFDVIRQNSKEMRRVVRQAESFAKTPFPCLILGETGTGKELLAKAIHDASTVKDGPFVPLNCGAIPESLLDSELFGHEKGAFTGAASARKGLLEAADGGTVFLDEIGDAPLAVQVKLLRALQEGRVRRVGSQKERPLVVRFLCATHRNIPALIREGTFREDLYYRVAVAVIRIPALRESPGEIGALLDHFLEEANRLVYEATGRDPKVMSPNARQLLIDYAWPGNVRELQNTVYRLVTLTERTRLAPDDVRNCLLEPVPKCESHDNAYLLSPFTNEFSIKSELSNLRRTYADKALRQTSGNLTKAAILMGTKKSTLSGWLKGLGRI